jgi:uncharacterized membrane protein YccF (DUF307 family)
MISFLCNIIWIVFGGIFIFLEYVLAGLILCLTIIGIPFGIQLFKLGMLGLFPFGKNIRTKESYSGIIAVLLNVIWILLGGIWISLTHVIFALVFAVTIIGIPFAVQHIKLAALALTPFGKEVV